MTTKWVVLLALAGCGDDDQVAEVWGGNLAVGSGRVFYTTLVGDAEHAVNSMSVDGGPSKELWRGGPHELFGDGMAVDADRVYWTQEENGGPNGLFAAPLGGGDRVEIAKFSGTQAARGGILVVGDWIVAAGGGELMRVPVAGGEREILIAREDTRFVAGIANNGTDTYVAIDGAEPQLVHLNTAAPAIEVIYRGPIAWPFCVDASAAYIPMETGITVVALDGTGIRDTIDLASSEGCAVGASGIYTGVHVDDAAGYDLLKVGFSGASSVIGHVTSPFMNQYVVADNRLHYAGLGVLGSIEIDP